MWLKHGTMLQVWKKEDPLIAVVNAYKEETSARSLTIDEVVDSVKDMKGYVVSLKIDGEMTLLHYAGGEAVLLSREGRARTEFEVTEEINDLLKGKKDVVAIGELHVVDEEDVPVSYPNAISILRKPDQRSQKNIRYAVFDLLEVDGEDFKGRPYPERMDAVKELFKGKYVFPALVEKGSPEVIRQLWNEFVEGKGYEGLVITSGESMETEERIKVKPLITIDAVVISVTKSKVHPEYMGALNLALLDEDRTFRTIGAVGTGFSIQNRTEWLGWAMQNKVDEINGTIFVDPYKDPRIVEVKTDGFHFRKTEAYTWIK